MFFNMAWTVIPHKALSPETLRGVLEDYTSRQGAETTDVSIMVDQVRDQLERGKVKLVYDSDTESCNVLPSRLVDGP